MIVNDQVRGFFEFIYDRQLIYHKKEVLKEDPPWTEDKTLHKFKFCNVYREADKGTKYILQKINGEGAALTRENKALNILIYRIFNKYNFFENVMGGEWLDYQEYDREAMEKTLDKAKDEGQTLFNDAYTINAGPVNRDYRPRVKRVQITFILEWMCKNMARWVTDLDKAETTEEALEVITRAPNVGDFLGSQLMVDFTYFGIFHQGWTGDNLCFIGPGAEWGIRIIAGRESMKPKEYKEFCKWLRDIQPSQLKDLYQRTGKNWDEIFYHQAKSNVPYLSTMNVQHSLCEYRKYYRLRNGEGRKRYYNNLEQMALSE